MYTLRPNIIYMSSTFWWEVFKLRGKALIKQKLCVNTELHIMKIPWFRERDVIDYVIILYSVFNRQTIQDILNLVYFY